MQPECILPQTTELYFFGYKMEVFINFYYYDALEQFGNVDSLNCILLTLHVTKTDDARRIQKVHQNEQNEFSTNNNWFPKYIYSH